MVSPATAPLPPLPALVDGHVMHRRAAPVRHVFRHRCYMWLVDLDRVPRHRRPLRAVAGFDATDHLGGTGPGASRDIRTNVLRFLARHGIDIAGARIVMLAHARVLGFVFNPLTVYWCLDAGGAVRCVVAEVHNTYGDVHAYLLEPDGEGRAGTAKEMYVSPFNDVSGRYAMRFALGPERVSVEVALLREGEPAFEASFEGTPRPATAAATAATALRRPLMPQRVWALIRVHALWLWLRRLPVLDRPRHTTQERV